MLQFFVFFMTQRMRTSGGLHLEPMVMANILPLTILLVPLPQYKTTFSFEMLRRHLAFLQIKHEFLFRPAWWFMTEGKANDLSIGPLCVQRHSHARFVSIASIHEKKSVADLLNTFLLLL